MSGVDRGSDSTQRKVGLLAPPPVLDTPELREALDCPLCGYSLRGLSAAGAEPRCPECGYRFDWEALLRARQFRHPYLFEHNPRRTLFAFLDTLIAGWQPRRFWASLNAGHEVRPAWLLVYALATTALTVLSVLAGRWAAYAILIYWRDFSWERLRMDGMTALIPGDYFTSQVQECFKDDGGMTPYFVAACAAWPWITLAALLLFQMSMRRVRVRVSHVLRCVVYSGDAFVWSVVVLAAAGAVGYFRRYDYYGEPQRIAMCLLLLLGVATYRLGQAYRLYLRFDHPWATVLTSQVLFVLSVITALALFCPGFWQLLW